MKRKQTSNLVPGGGPAVLSFAMKFLCWILTSSGLLTLNACGAQSTPAIALASGSSGIMGGVETRATDPISRVAVEINFDHNGMYTSFCSGSLIDADYVITAAHCADDEGLATSVVFQDGRSVKAQSQILDPLWASSRHASTGHHDFLMVKIETQPPYLKPAVLANDQDVPADGAAVSIAGYGQVSALVEGSTKLQRVDLKMQSRDLNPFESLVSEDATHGACFGDSGGPAYVVRGHDVVLWGVDSRVGDGQSADCGGAEIYSKVSAERAWMTTVIQAPAAKKSTPSS